MREELRRQAVIRADGMVAQVLKEKEQAPSTESGMWAYASAKGAKEAIRCFNCHDSRKGACANSSKLRGIAIDSTDDYMV